MIEYVIKANGERQEFNADKLNQWADWAAQECGLSWSDIAISAMKKGYDGCSTKELHQAMISSCVEKEDTAHLKMAARLLIGAIYKEVYGGHDKIVSLGEFYESKVESGGWEDMDYSKEEIAHLEEVIDHSKDFGYTFSELKQFVDKYAVQSIVEQRVHESPQMMYMGMSMAAMKTQPKERRLEDVSKLYHFLSDRKINTPTPYLNGLRTKSKGFASCCVINGDDTAPSLGVAEHIAYTMTYHKAGIGAFLNTRSVKDPVRGGATEHLGKLPYYRTIDSAVKANTQVSRGGSATVHYNILDPQIEDLLVLKNPTTPDQKRINFLDYSVGVNSSFAQKVAKNEDWMLVSVYHAPELHKLFYSADIEGFAEEYERVLADDSVKKKSIKAREIAIKMMEQRVETGRVYIHWVDALNQHTPFKDPIYSSNLCQEIALPTAPYQAMDELYGYKDTKGEVALCFLSAIVAGRVEPEEYEEVAYYTLLMIDNIIDEMEYPFTQMAETSSYRRSVGVGITNLAYDIARRGLSYTMKAGKNYIHRLAELHSFSLHRASLRIAKEKGVCKGMESSKYPEGWLPVDTYTRNVDSAHSQELEQDWEALRMEIVANGGIRHSVLEAYMPAESSSLASNTCNSIYPVRQLTISKKSRKGSVFFMVPEYDTLRWQYQFAWDVPTKDLIDVYAIFQKFTGQAISSDFYLDYTKLPNGKVSNKELLQNFLYATKMGMKTQYYLNSRVGVGSGIRDTIQESGCTSGGCSL